MVNKNQTEKTTSPMMPKTELAVPFILRLPPDAIGQRIVCYRGDLTDELAARSCANFGTRQQLMD